MMDVLHGVDGTLNDPEGSTKGENVRRGRYEGARQIVFMTTSALELLRAKIFSTLKAAVEEARPLIDETLHGQIVTVDKWETAPAIMINCLAADLQLRRVGREIEEMWEAFHEDASGGAGRQTVWNQFQILSEQYRGLTAKPANTGHQGGSAE